MLIDRPLSGLAVTVSLPVGAAADGASAPFRYLLRTGAVGRVERNGSIEEDRDHT